jgi:hypothetical protein
MADWMLVKRSTASKYGLIFQLLDERLDGGPHLIQVFV